MRRSVRVGLALAFLMLVEVTVAGPAIAAPQIRLLDPSPLASGQVPKLSTAGGPLHFVAWVQEVPVLPQAEFELQLVGGPLPGQAQTIDATRVGTGDTWEAFYEVPSSVPEGQYEVTARLYSEGREVASSSQLATLDRADVAPAAEALEIQYPVNGEPFGLFRSSAGLEAKVRVATTAATDQVEVFYSTTPPGALPTWTSCGLEVVVQPRVTVRCRITGGVGPTTVSAIAAVANNTPPPGDPQRVADDGMDAHRARSYLQTASQVSVSPSAVRTDVGACRIFTVTVLDQLSSEVVGAPVDVHAEGPTDQLRFAVADTTPLRNDTDPFQAPNESHVSREAATRCSDDSVLGQQGDHNQIGIPDRKHIESVTGTEVDGGFRFALASDAAGSTSITAWSDVQEDDFQSAAEPSGVAAAGWGQEPPPPARYIFLDPDLSSASTETCRRIVAVARDGPDPMAGANIDLHLAGPETVRFCSPRRSDPRLRPDAGAHSGSVHGEGTRHTEGTTDDAGRFVFGVTSRASGESTVTAWMDLFDDDTQVDGEPTAIGRITWVRDGERTISIRASKRQVRSGESVEISGEIVGDPDCLNDQRVVLKAREEGASGFVTIDRTSTNPRGFYNFSVVVTRTRDYRTVSPRSRSPKCFKARSHDINIRSR